MYATTLSKSRNRLSMALWNIAGAEETPKGKRVYLAGSLDSSSRQICWYRLVSNPASRTACLCTNKSSTLGIGYCSSQFQHGNFKVTTNTNVHFVAFQYRHNRGSPIAILNGMPSFSVLSRPCLVMQKALTGLCETLVLLWGQFGSWPYNPSMCLLLHQTHCHTAAEYQDFRPIQPDSAQQVPS